MFNKLTACPAAVAAVVLLGAAGRLACLGGELWLDEIWSWGLARGAPSPAAVFTVRHDNNHPLNSLWLRAWPASAPLALLRLHSFLAGLAAVAAAAVVARRRGRAEAVFAAALVAGCPWLVLASAEARGYALAVFFALAALEALWRHLDSDTPGPLAAFWAFSVLGFLSHLTFVHAYVGFLIWSMRRFARERPSRPGGPSAWYEVRRLALCHGPVAAFFLAYYFLTIRGMEVGGGPRAPTADVLGRLISVGAGGPAEGAFRWPVVAVAVLLFAAGLWLIRRSRGDAWAAFAAAAVGSPALFLVRPPPVLFERYFFVSLAFFLPPAAFALGELWRRKAFRPLALGLLAAFLVGSAWHVRALAAAGRGAFEEALGWVAEHDPGGEVVATGDHDWRVGMYVDFYARRRGLAGRVHYLGGPDSAGATWLLVHREPDDPRGEPAAVERIEGARFTLVKAYPSRGRPAWGWYVYRREVPAPR